MKKKKPDFLDKALRSMEADRKKQLAQLKKMMKDPNSEYWRGENAAKFKAAARRLTA